MRKPGWYWVKYGKEKDWECRRLVSNGYWASHDGVMETEPSEVGPRIPTPDEPWQCVPVEPTVEMKQACDHDTPGPITAWKAWQVMLKTTPKPETQP